MKKIKIEIPVLIEIFRAHESRDIVTMTATCEMLVPADFDGKFHQRLDINIGKHVKVVNAKGVNELNITFYKL